VVVVVFTCNSCPIANDYEGRVNAFAKQHAGPESKVALVAINVNTIPDDRLDKMKQRAEKKKYSYPYLYDETQKIARDYGANYTPEFFVLDKNARSSTWARWTTPAMKPRQNKFSRTGRNRGAER